MGLETAFEDIVPLYEDEDSRNEQLRNLLSLSALPGDSETSPLGAWEVVCGSGLLFSAPHEATHIRDGREKAAEQDTGALAFALARATGGAALATVPGQLGDPSWDLEHPYVARAAALAADAPAVDLHMMRPRGVELCVGLGPLPERSATLWRAIMEEALAAGLRAAVNWPFAANPRTVTGQLQRRGLRAIQLELSWDCFQAGHPAQARAWSALVRAARRLAGQAGSASGA